MLGLLYSIADAGRELLRRTPGESTPAKAILPLCHALLGSRGEASGTALARDVTEAYRALSPAERLSFFRGLLEEFNVDGERIVAAAEAYRERRDLDSYLALAAAVEPPRQELIRRINMAPRGTETIVAMRADLLRLLDDHPELKAVDVDLRHLLAAWFNRGFLVLERIDWSSPAVILEKLIAYEAVHAMDGWDDLRRRLAADRRCFAFFHPALPDEPLIFVEVALQRGMAAAIEPLLDRRTPVADVADADTAVFYSISNCQTGLRGISFGNFLIKQVVLELANEVPSLKRFVTLSPIPRFRGWLAQQLAADDGAALSENERAAARAVQDESWAADEAVAEALREPLLRLCARYFLTARGGDGRPLDPVARFHLGNGARLERINWRGDMSPKALRESAGLLANYLYDLKSIEKNHEAYAKSGKVTAASEVVKLAR
ncbi:MAG: malonyl-CoA decarboxylase [Rhodospirillaceae bacterium]|nr:malonyl-CoA decarboxylase [Rhodospirillaceae bacterium]